MVRFRRVCRGQRTRHVWKEVTGTWETLAVPLPKVVVSPTIEKEKDEYGGESDSAIILGERESRSHGEGNNRTKTRACKGNINRTGRIGVSTRVRVNANLTAGSSTESKTGQKLSF